MPACWLQTLLAEFYAEIYLIIMEHIWGIFATVIALAFIVWLLVGSPPSSGVKARAESDVLDADNPADLSYLVGMFGGSIEDAAIAQFALRRFEETHGRKATVRESGELIGVMFTLR